MSVDRELLWKAWPSGCLAMRGVSTVGGWLCLDPKGASDPHYATWRHELEGQAPPPVIPMISAGELLPNVDPADTATWACLLEDLATAMGYGGIHGGLCWARMDKEGRPSPAASPNQPWTLRGAGSATRQFPTQGLGFHYPFPSVKADTPALALVLARIQIREEKGR